MTTKEMQDSRPLVELDARENDGISVSLLWDATTDETFIELETENEWERFEVPNERASDAFAHPYVYATVIA